MLLNLTPHQIQVHKGDKVEVIEPFGIVPRVENEYYETRKVNGVPILTRKTIKTANLPQPQTNVLYIVSNIVRLENLHRKDLISPSGQFRDENNKVIGCTSFIGNDEI